MQIISYTQSSIMSFLFYYRFIVAAACYRKTCQGKRLHLPSRPLPPVLMSNIFDSTRYCELQSEDEDDEINEKEKPSESFPLNKENPYQDDEHIYEYAQPK